MSPVVVPDYAKLFVNRGAYTVQSAKPNPESGRYYYYPPTEKADGKPLELTAETLRRHDVKNLFVTDAAEFVSCACQNPMLTSMALCVRSCDYLMDEMRKGNI
ncbi:MAG TPA: GMC oxidoreductase [Terriglobia bacterium]|nr:GMC oxidoreductase [Terriglobia bacterium]